MAGIMAGTEQRSNWEGRKVFVTGVTGFLGTALAASLREQGAEVTGLARRSSSPRTQRWLERLGVALVDGDIAREQPACGGLRDALQGAELVVHCAAIIGYRRRLAGLMARTNVLGTRAVVDACVAAGTQRLLHVSSIAAVGVSDRPELLDEGDEWNADVLRAPYFDTKYAAEQEALAGLDRGLDVVVVNPAAIYGPSSTPSNSSNLICQVLSGRIGFVPPGGVNAVPLETVVRGCLAALRHGRRGRRYILGGENLTIAELVQRVGRAAGLELMPRMLPAALGPPLRAALELVEPLVPDDSWFTPDMCAMFGRYLWFDVRRAETELGVAPGDLDACLRATVEQLRQDGRAPSSGDA
jgi:dihydroflavonol-4-reductase